MPPEFHVLRCSELWLPPKPQAPFLLRRCALLTAAPETAACVNDNVPSSLHPVTEPNAIETQDSMTEQSPLTTSLRNLPKLAILPWFLECSLTALVAFNNALTVHILERNTPQPNDSNTCETHKFKTGWLDYFPPSFWTGFNAALTSANAASWSEPDASICSSAKSTVIDAMSLKRTLQSRFGTWSCNLSVYEYSCSQLLCALAGFN